MTNSTGCVEVRVLHSACGSYLLLPPGGEDDFPVVIDRGCSHCMYNSGFFFPKITLIQKSYFLPSPSAEHLKVPQPVVPAIHWPVVFTPVGFFRMRGGKKAINSAMTYAAALHSKALYTEGNFLTHLLSTVRCMMRNCHGLLKCIY